MNTGTAQISKTPSRRSRFAHRFNTEQFFERGVGLFTVVLDQKKTSDQTLQDIAARMRNEQRRVLGHVQIKSATLGACHCREMHLVDLSSGARTRIFENRGPEARGCHLDWAALSEAVQAIEAELSLGADALIVNRFGRAEAEGKGMRSAIEKALGLGIPVIVGVRPDYVEVWQAFHGGLARTVSLDQDTCALFLQGS